MKKIILITGGQRSGKSTHAEALALSLSDRPIYLATARVWDDEFRERVAMHQARRGPQWTNVEENLQLSRVDVQGRVVLIDCLTLWATNWFFDLNPGDNPSAAERKAHVERTLQALQEEFDRFTAQEATFIFVTNELGMGGVSENAVQRSFTDLLGWFNQYVAARADEVILMVSGLPVVIKGK